MRNFKEIEHEINEHLSNLNKHHSETIAMVEAAVERLSETRKEIEELEKTRNELKKKIEEKNAH